MSDSLITLLSDLWDRAVPWRASWGEEDWLRSVGLDPEVREAGPLDASFLDEAARLPANAVAREQAEPQWLVLPGGHYLHRWGASSGIVVKVRGAAAGRDRVLVAHDESVTPVEVSDLICSVAGGLLLPREAILPFHASSVALEDEGLLFLGASGQGKSTAVDLFVGAGARMIGDEIAPVRRRARGFEILPGFPAMDFWDRRGEMTSLRPMALATLSRAGGKTRMLFDRHDARLTGEPVSLAALYLLNALTGPPEEGEPRDEARFERLSSREGFFELMRASCYLALRDERSLRGTRDLLAGLAEEVGVTRLTYRRGADSRRVLLEAVLAARARARAGRTA